MSRLVVPSSRKKTRPIGRYCRAMATKTQSVYVQRAGCSEHHSPLARSSVAGFVRRRLHALRMTSIYTVCTTSNRRACAAVNQAPSDFAPRFGSRWSRSARMGGTGCRAADFLLLWCSAFEAGLSVFSPSFGETAFCQTHGFMRPIARKSYLSTMRFIKPQPR